MVVSCLVAAMIFLASVRVCSVKMSSLGVISEATLALMDDSLALASAMICWASFWAAAICF